MDMSWAEYWWNRVTGPREAVLAIADALSEGRSVSLCIPGDLPWRHEMRAAVRDALQSSYGREDVIFETIDGDELPPTFENPGTFLLERFALASDRLSFRPRPGKTIQAFLVDKEVLKNRVVWIKGLTQDSGAAWLSFCEQYPSASINTGLFIIETIEAGKGQDCNTANTEKILLSKYVSVFDAMLINSVMIRDNLPQITDVRKRYFSSLVTHLCETDVEVAAHLISQPDFLNADPLDLVARIADMQEFSRRGSQSSNHVLALSREGERDSIKKRVWEAQTESLYPLVESERLGIISRLEGDLDNLIQGPGISQFEDKVLDPRDVELGTLVFLLAKRRLYVPDSELRRRIHLLRDCRNLIAHNECCSLEQVNSLLGT